MTAPAESPSALPENGLAHFPISFFSVLMGGFGLTIALLRGADALGFSALPGVISLWVFGVVFAVVALTYLTKALRYPGQIVWEWNHPVRINFFPAMSISVLLFATALWAAGYADLARPLWVVGAAGQAALTLAVVASWISHRAFMPGQLGPAWFIPAVGNIVAPVAGGALGFAELSWYFYATGMIFYFVLLTLVMNRLFFHDPIPAKLQPTLVILIAPPAIGFIAHSALVGGLDPMGRVLAMATVLFTGIVLTQLRKLLRVPFSMAFWALSFPVAALALACFRYAELAGIKGFLWGGAAALAILPVIILVLAFKTVKGLLSGEICVPE
ncbi:SLAC1 anion channel family protein [Vannielia sp.]|uniref:SLAC1 anion channel family protein n=1 Tax=Vannielia sp. TaxID=2813045 RepID=UPI002625182B|nr:SLAC1 anion channel family protein [Vannielia sp.]MDF1872710.1 SLAC1 anion channel family protein [Vannielia sp.]